MATTRDVLTATTLMIAVAALVVSGLSLAQARIPGPRGPPGETVYLPSWPPPPCEPNCSWQPVRTFTSSGGMSDNVNVTGSEVKAAWSLTSGMSCDATLSVTFHHHDGAEAGTDLTFLLVNNLPGPRSDTFDFPTGIPSGGVYPGAYRISVGASNTCGSGWTWSVAVQEWR